MKNTKAVWELAQQLMTEINARSIEQTDIINDQCMGYQGDTSNTFSVIFDKLVTMVQSFGVFDKPGPIELQEITDYQFKLYTHTINNWIEYLKECH